MIWTNDINNNENFLNSMDIKEYIEELENELEEAGIEFNANPCAYPDFTPILKELQILYKLCDEAKDYGDWNHGAILIRHSAFTDYVKELMEELKEVQPDSWLYNFVDWEAAASELKKHDYAEVNYGGVAYYIHV